MSRVLYVGPPYDCWGVQVIGTWPPLHLAYLAGAAGGPVLLVPRDTLPTAVAEEVLRLQAKRAVVIGAGGAGLTAARELMSAGVSALVLEARKALGPVEALTGILMCGLSTGFVTRPSEDGLRRGKKYLLAYVGVMGPQDGVDGDDAWASEELTYDAAAPTVTLTAVALPAPIAA